MDGTKWFYTVFPGSCRDGDDNLPVLTESSLLTRRTPFEGTFLKLSEGFEFIVYTPEREVFDRTAFRFLLGHIISSHGANVVEVAL